eukprot:TRINITY_DN737_c0_g4_i2.p1 TRINITY_DN737_c0_g4~~TRINITY_DN737_c0_g4_i2.p1  ORF type:complete len:413 (+),score=101.15 TRINITY_DN737_c0_g4_i2:58-1296(+)
MADLLSFELKDKRLIAPLVVRFPAGPPAGLTDQGAHLNIPVPDFHYFQNPKADKAHQRIVVAETPTVSYVGANFGAQSSKKTSRRYAVGLLNTEKKKIELAEVECLYTMSQIVKGVDDIEDEEEKVSNEGAHATKKRQLVDTFGSRKSQKQMRSAAASQVKPQDAESLEAISHAMEISSEFEFVKVDAESSINTTVLPPYDIHATDPAHIYPLERIISNEIMESLEPEAIFGQTHKPLAPAFIKHRAQLLTEEWEQLPEDERNRRGRILLFIFYALRFARTKPSFDRDYISQTQAHIPGPVMEYFLQNFAQQQLQDENSFVRSNYYQLKLRLHVCVLAMIEADFALDISSVIGLSQDFGLVPPKCVDLFKHIGCTVSDKIKKVKDASENRSVAARLKAPLTFPKPPQGQAKQ